MLGASPAPSTLNQPVFLWGWLRSFAKVNMHLKPDKRRVIKLNQCREDPKNEMRVYKLETASENPRHHAFLSSPGLHCDPVLHTSTPTAPAITDGS